jgi:GH15 family glucan-1,4-alpha-glucosidase
VSSFAPPTYLDGHLPTEDFGLIGDLSTAALVGRDGSIPWLCLPRFDAPPVFSGILDKEKGGAFTVTPVGLQASRQYYLEDSGVLVTEMRAAGGTVRVTDALTLRAGADLAEGTPAERSELLRCIKVLAGTVTLNVSCAPKGGAEGQTRSGGLHLELRERPELNLHLLASRPLSGLTTVYELNEGEELHLRLTWGHPSHRYQPIHPDEVIKNTVASWRRWLGCFNYGGPRYDLVRRSAITLKLLSYSRSGAVVAAPTSSLPETIGGERNWDYRYTWVRDAAFAVYALRQVGITQEARSFLGWVLDALERHQGAKILYTIDGERPKCETEDGELSGYRGSAPVRWSNGAAEQTQHDVYGEIIDCTYLWALGGGTIDAPLWEKLCVLIERAREVWREPDQGIWEVRCSGRPFTYSVAMCHVALERGARLAERYGLPGDAKGWRKEAELIRETILKNAWDDELGSLTEHIGADGGLDASLLALPLRRVIDADHPKMKATTEAIVKHLSAKGACGDGLLYRYLPERSPDGLGSDEGAFVLCSFWLVDILADQGRIDEAEALFHSLCDRVNHLGLFAEEIDPDSGRFLGNFPQAFSHIGVITSATNLVKRKGEQDA